MALCLLTALTLGLGFANKARCTGPEFDQRGRSEPAYQQRSYAEVCYSDIQDLWLGRDINHHVFPYVSGGMTEGGSLFGGAVEYPVLSGLLMWLGAAFAHTDAGFLSASALLLAPFGLATTWWLGRLSGRRALLWALAPPLVLYAFHNWDLAAVACATAAVFAVHRWNPTSPRGRAFGAGSLRRRAFVAAALLGTGFAVKIYPGLFALPLALHVLTSGRSDGQEAGDARRGLDVRGALGVIGTAVATAVLLNLPFALFGFRGWLASFAFQSAREVDLSSNSIWYWAFRSQTDSDAFQSLVAALSPILMAASFALACWIGWREYRRSGTYPWIQVSAAMLCGFLLLHKVHSPQYTLWLLPFFVLVSVRWGWVVAYLLADAAMGIGVFRWMYTGSGLGGGFEAQAVVIGVWGRAALLVGLYVAFLSARSTVERADRSPADAPTARLRSSPGVGNPQL